MARILMLAQDIANAGRLEGDPVAIVDDSHVFSENEDIRVYIANHGSDTGWEELFYVIDITGMPLAEAQRFLEEWKRPAEPGELEYEAPDPEDRCITLGPHRWQLGIQDRMPPNLANQLRRDFYLEYTYNAQTIAVLNDYIIDRCGVDTFISSTLVRCCG